MPLQEEEVQQALSKVLLQENQVDGLDEDLIAYLSGLLAEAGLDDDDSDGITSTSIQELMGPFLESMACPSNVMEQATDAVVGLAVATEPSNNNNNTGAAGEARRLKQGLVSMSSHLSQQSETEVEANRYLWGTDSGVAAMTNTQIDAYSDKSSAKEKRKQRQELQATRREYQAKLEQQQLQEAAQQGVVSAMVLPDYRSGRNERDVQVRNVSLSLDNGRSLLDNGELKFAHQRRYGLVGKNGVGAFYIL